MLYKFYWYYRLENAEIAAKQISQMRKKAYIIWAIFLAVPGAVGLWATHARQATLSEQVQRWRSQVQDGTDDYLNSYQKWSALSNEQKVDNPWGKGIYGGESIQKQLQHDQNKRLAVDIAELASGEKTLPSELADVLYGPGWEQQIEQYKSSIEIQELVRLCSLVCLTGGIVVFIITFFASAAGAFIQRIRERRTPKEVPAELPEETKPKCAEPLKPRQCSSIETTTETQPPESHPSQDQPAESPELQTETASVSQQTADGGYFGSLRSARRTAGFSSHTPRPDYETCKTETDVMVSSVEPSSLMTTEPVLNSLSELTEEVSAIRQFAARQQDQVKKLQDGYDWMLIRRFCMRIIRCIDNLTDRIRRTQQQEQDTQTLEEIRDELSIALESSGVEQFEPDLGVEYKGLERYAEAIGEKEPNDKPEKSGTIARVLRPGYQYLISDEEVKIVRCAQVKLFE